jgi:hypothetical protein
VKFVPIIQSAEQLDWVSTLPVDEVIFYHQQFSREGGLGFDEIKPLAELAKSKGFRALIQVDRLIEESNFEAILKTCLSWPKSSRLRSSSGSL